MKAISWKDLSRHNSAGDLWVAINGKAYDVSAWSKQHPGGALVLLHSAGKDATNPFGAYHPPFVRNLLSKYCLGDMEALSVPLSAEDRIFAQLQAKCYSSGLMKARVEPYSHLAIFLIAIFALAANFAYQGMVIPSALLLALFWQQVAFIGHDLGHSAVTCVGKVDSLWGLLVNAGVGIGMSWWKSTHNVHHLVVNAADSDPDIQFMPLLAVSEHFFGEVWSRYHQDLLIFDRTAQWLIGCQHLTFIPLLMIAKFGLYLQTVKHLWSGKAYINRCLEAAAQLLFFSWYTCFLLCFSGLQQKLAFVLLSHAAFFVLHLQICLSHFACPTLGEMPEKAEAWMTQQVRGTMNWSCPPWLDWFHGGLQFQIEHHLFPRMPRHNLRAASELVKPACRELGLSYHCPSFSQAVLETLDMLQSTALQAKSVDLASLNSKSTCCESISRQFI